MITRRLLEEADLPLLAAIEGSRPHPWSTSQMLEDAALPQSRFWVFEDAVGQIVGYLDSWWVMDEVEIINTAVHPRHRREGVGRAMVTALIEAASLEEVLHIHLEVRASNAPAIGLYTSTGFQVAGRRRGYYPHPRGGREDAVLMTRALASGVD